jgi:PKD repeat protein
MYNNLAGGITYEEGKCQMTIPGRGIIAVAVAMAGLYAGCSISKGNDAGLGPASFSFSPTSPAVGQSVQFTDTTTGGPTSWQWDFGDGMTSTVQNPAHTYMMAGLKPVTLVVTNATDTKSASQTVTVVATLTASFSYSPASPAIGQAVQFTDTSAGTPTSWSWNFGDGATSTAQNPSHSYTTTGSMTVTLMVTKSTDSDSISRPLMVVSSSAIVIDHTCAKLANIPSEWIAAAKQNLHIAYGHTSHGSQLTTGMTGLVTWKGDLYAWNFGGTDGALDLREWNSNFGSPDVTTVAYDLGNPNRTAWEAATREYLAEHTEVNVIIWAWCWQVNGTEAEIQTYLNLMDGLERDYPNVRFVHMTGHLVGEPLTGNPWEINVGLRNKQIRDYCLAHDKILYDFADIESYNPDGDYFGDKLANDACDYDSNGDGVLDSNWAVNWQNAHPGEWYDCVSAHSQPLNANLKAYAAWHLWARLAGWDGN